MNNNFISAVRYEKKFDDLSYLNNLNLVKYFENNKEFHFDKKVTIIIGENGTGKSTFIEALAVAYGFNAEGGSKNFNFSTKRTHSELSESFTILRNKYPKTGYFLRSESFYNVISNIDDLDKDKMGGKIINSYGGVSMHKMSHGQSFMALVNNRFSSNGLYILDEPESALSPLKLMSLIVKINELVNENCQFIIATHSPILMAYPDAEVFEITKDGINKINYKDSEHFYITKEFLNNPEKMISLLIESD